MVARSWKMLQYLNEMALDVYQYPESILNTGLSLDIVNNWQQSCYKVYGNR